MRLILRLTALLFLFQTSVSAQSIFDLVAQSEAHDTLEAALIAASLDGTLDGEGNFTLFAPTDDAFAALPAGTLEDLLMDPDGQLATILTYHVLGSQVASTDLSNGIAAETLEGKDVIVAIRNDSVFINNALVTMVDVQADNGVIHFLDAVLLPPSTVTDVVVNSELHNTLETAVVAAGLNTTLAGDGPFTLFAPTDAAFAAIDPTVLSDLLADPQGALTDVLTYHVLADSVAAGDLSSGIAVATVEGRDVVVAIRNDSVFINNSLVTITDIQTDNGIVHVIDAVLLPPATIVDVVVNSQLHNTLETAVVAAGLDGTLSGDGPFTLFAPTDAAFAAIDPTVLSDLLADPQGALTDVLTYHALADSVAAGDLSNGIAAETVQGTDVIVAIRNDSVFINNSLVIITDIEAGNGIVHVIDAVLLPPANIVDVVVNSQLHNTLETAVLAAGLETTLTGDGPFTLFAPTDAAFAAVDPTTLNALLADPQGSLTQVLLYHAISGEVLAGSLVDELRAETVQGDSLEFNIEPGVAQVNGNNIIITDIQVGNGVIHVIDGVLIPNVVSVERLDASGLDIQVFPNPVSETLIVDIQEAGVQTVSIQLTNYLGQDIAQWQVGIGRHPLDIGQVQNGIYFLRLNIDGKEFYQPVVVSK